MSTDAPSVGVTEAPIVTLELSSRPETLTLVRGMLGGVAELLAIDAELLDDLKTAVSEACNNVVMHAYPESTGPLWVELYVRVKDIEVIVRDEGIGLTEGAPLKEHVRGVGIPVIRALTRLAEFRSPPRGGTEVAMMFAAQRDGARLLERPADAIPDDGWARNLDGDAVASVSPVALLGAVLGRLARALAAHARFSLDRFSDVYLVSDAIAAHAASAAISERIGFAISAESRRLELTIGPLRRGSGTDLRGQARDEDRRSPLSLLSDELELVRIGDSELLRVVMIDQRRWLSD